VNAENVSEQTQVQVFGPHLLQRQSAAAISFTFCHT